MRRANANANANAPTLGAFRHRGLDPMRSLDSIRFDWIGLDSIGLGEAKEAIDSKMQRNATQRNAHTDRFVSIVSHTNDDTFVSMATEKHYRDSLR